MNDTPANTVTAGAKSAASRPADAAPSSKPGRLFCIPTPIGETRGALAVLPADTLERVRELAVFVAESAKRGRHFLKQVDPARDLPGTQIMELNEHTPAGELGRLLAPLLAGHDVGLLSDAGCPGVADPGATLVAAAQQRGIRVIPLIGPCSMILSLMASGMNGQRFAFVGYIAADREQRERELKALERRSGANAETILMIETPYRARALLDSMLACLAPHTRVCVARELGEPDEAVLTKTIAAWRLRPPELPKGRAVFLLEAPLHAPLHAPLPGKAPSQRIAPDSVRKPRNKV